MSSPEITIIEGLSVERLFPALGHEAIQAASQTELDLIMQEPKDPYRIGLRNDFIREMADLSEGELGDTDFRVAEQIKGFTDYARELKLTPNYVSDVKLPLSDISDLYPIRQKIRQNRLKADENINVTALDVVKEYPEGQKAVRLIDARGVLGTRTIDKHGLMGANATKMKRQDWRMLRDVSIELDKRVYPLSNISRKLLTPELGGFNTILYNKARDTGRSYFRYGNPITDQEPEGYKVALSLIRLADCATKEGEEDIYWRLFHTHLN